MTEDIRKNGIIPLITKIQLWLKGDLQRYIISVVIMISITEILLFIVFSVIRRSYLSESVNSGDIVPGVIAAALIIILLVNVLIIVIAVNKLSKSLHNFIAKNLPVGIIVFDFSGKISYVNPRFTEIFGYSYKDLEQPVAFMHSVFPDEQIRKRTIETFRSDISEYVKNTEKTHLLRNHQIVCKDGSVKYAEVTIAIYNGLIYNVLVDISSRKKAEDELVILNQELEKIVSERTRELESSNNRYEATNRELSGTNEELERTIDLLQRTQDQLLHNEKLALLGQLAAGIAHEINTPLGAIISANDHQNRMYARILPTLPEFIKSLDESEYSLFTGIHSGIKNNSDDLPYKEKSVVKKNLVKTLDDAGVTDPAVIADDLIDLCIYNDIEKYLPELTGKRAHEILRMNNNLKSLSISGSIISQASEKAAKVVGALKTYSHTSAKDVKSAEDITSSIDTVLTLYYNKTKSGIRIIKKYEPVSPVICYPDRLGQVWTNLINNAFHAMDYKGILEIWVRMIDGKVTVSITDNGKGIDMDAQDKVFNPFFTTKKAGEGTGLGLDIVKKIVEDNGGTVSFESEPGCTTFTVSLDPGGSE